MLNLVHRITDPQVVVVALNLSPSDAHLDIQGLQSSPRTEFVLTAPALDSPVINLNGSPLALSKTGKLPNLQGKAFPPSSPLVLQGHSYGFYVFDNVDFIACK